LKAAHWLRYQLQQVSGLLQTRDDACAVAAAGQAPDGRHDRAHVRAKVTSDRTKAA